MKTSSPSWLKIRLLMRVRQFDDESMFKMPTLGITTGSVRRASYAMVMLAGVEHS